MVELYSDSGSLIYIDCWLIWACLLSARAKTCLTHSNLRRQLFLCHAHLFPCNWLGLFFFLEFICRESLQKCKIYWGIPSFPGTFCFSAPAFSICLTKCRLCGVLKCICFLENVICLKSAWWWYTADRWPFFWYVQPLIFKVDHTVFCVHIYIFSFQFGVWKKAGRQQKGARKKAVDSQT